MVINHTRPSHLPEDDAAGTSAQITVKYLIHMKYKVPIRILCFILLATRHRSPTFTAWHYGETVCLRRHTGHLLPPTTPCTPLLLVGSPTPLVDGLHAARTAAMGQRLSAAPSASICSAASGWHTISPPS